MRSWDGLARNSAEPDLFSYARQGNLEGLKRLLNERTVNSRAPYGYTPLILAAYNGYADLVEHLLDHGANPDLQNSAGDSALMGAAFRGHLVVVLMLLRRGASASLTNAKGLNALGLATLFGRHEIVFVLNRNLAERAA